MVKKTDKSISPDLPLALALDIGSSSVRTMLFDPAGRVVEGTQASEAYRVGTDREGAAEADPEAVLDCAFRSLDATLTRAGRLAGRLRGIGVCTLVSNILGVGADGRAVSPLYTYADTRAQPDAAALRAELDELTIHDRTGCRLHSSYLSARFRWLARTDPALFHRAQRWMSIGEYLLLRLFGHTHVSYSVASWTGLLDRRALKWDEDLLDVLPIKGEQLSPLTDIDQPFSGLTGEFARRWPALKEALWFPAVGDGAAANIGADCGTPRRMALTIGTTAALRIVTSSPIERIPRGLWCYRVDRRRLLPGGALTEGGGLYAWLTANFRLEETDAVEAALASMQPDAHGLTVLPFLWGERSPGWAEGTRGTIYGICAATTALDVLRACLEAVALRLTLIFNELAPLAPALEHVVANGGAILQSPAWLQIVADALGQTVVATTFPEASSRGAAMLVHEALGTLADESSLPDLTGQVYEPDEGRHAIYQGASERQRELYRKVVVAD